MWRRDGRLWRVGLREATHVALLSLVHSPMLIALVVDVWEGRKTGEMDGKTAGGRGRGSEGGEDALVNTSGRASSGTHGIAFTSPLGGGRGVCLSKESGFHLS